MDTRMSPGSLLLSRLAEEAPAIIALGERLLSVPETGFTEHRTAAMLAEALRGIGVEPETGIAITGLKAAAGPAGAPEIVLLADMDALPTAGTASGVAHSCGHHAQMTVMFAAFSALVRAGAPDREGFRLVLIASPAEEYVEIDRRLALRSEGKIRYLSGKQEMLRLGAFGNPAAILKYHSMQDAPQRLATVNGTLNGFMGKRAVFTGRPAHAGLAPEKGINALNAASIALHAIHSQRETFMDDDHIRVHPILREGGTTVNTVPDRAILETYIRGADHRAVMDAARKVDRALAAGAIAVGATVRITDTPGYQAFHPSEALGRALEARVRELLPPEDIRVDEKAFASDDVGDVASMFPTCQLGWGGFSGVVHSAEFRPCDPVRAYLEPARVIASTALDLGSGGARLALGAKAAFTPKFTLADYLASLDAQFSDRTIAWEP